MANRSEGVYLAAKDLEFDMLIFPRLNTKRLVLRKLEVDDLSSLVKYANNKKISDRIVNLPFPFREPDAALRMAYVANGFKNRTRFVFAIIAHDTKELIGEIALHLLDKTQAHAQLAYWIAEPYWNQGLGTEAAEAVLEFGFDRLEVELIYADCHVENSASTKLLSKIGMKLHRKNGNLLLFHLPHADFVATKKNSQQ